VHVTNAHRAQTPSAVTDVIRRSPRRDGRDTMKHPCPASRVASAKTMISNHLSRAGSRSLVSLHVTEPHDVTLRCPKLRRATRAEATAARRDLRKAAANRFGFPSRSLTVTVHHLSEVHRKPGRRSESRELGAF
jgi:hypothetical protein